MKANDAGGCLLVALCEREANDVARVMLWAAEERVALKISSR